MVNQCVLAPFGGLGNIVLDEKSGSELGDKLEIVKWREKYLFCVFDVLISNLAKMLAIKVMLLFTFFRYTAPRFARD